VANKYYLCVIGGFLKEIEVLGSGCAKCVKTAELIQTVANDCGIPVHVVKASSPEVMLKYGVMSTPAVVVDNQLMHSGSVPDRKKIEEWLT
jgi:predicted thioredoxin/glutaredoxin